MTFLVMELLTTPPLFISVSLRPAHNRFSTICCRDCQFIEKKQYEVQKQESEGV